MISGRARTLAVLAIIVVVGMVCASSLSVRPSSASAPLVAEKVDEQDGIRFTLALQKVEFEVGEPVNITLTVTNISNQTITYLDSPPEFDFAVYDVSNHSVYRWSSFQIWPRWVALASLDPGDSHTCVLVWLQTCNQTWEGPEGVPVSPGRYFIIGYWEHTLLTDPLQVDIGIERPTPTIILVGVVGAAVAVPVVVLVAAVLLARKR